VSNPYGVHSGLYDGELMGHPFRSVAKSFQLEAWRELCAAWKELPGQARVELNGWLGDPEAAFMASPS
jgi:hypothetical protein